MVLVLVVGIEKFPYYLAWASNKTALPVYVIKRDQSVPSVAAFGITEYMIVFLFCSSNKDHKSSKLQIRARFYLSSSFERQTVGNDLLHLGLPLNIKKTTYTHTYVLREGWCKFQLFKGAIPLSSQKYSSVKRHSQILYTMKGQNKPHIGHYD